MNTLEIVLPFPAAALSPNRKNGRAWQSSAASKSQARADARLATLEAINGKRPVIATPINVCIIFYCPDFRKRDLDNLLAALKHSIDGIADTLGVDDSRFNEMRLVKSCDKSNPRVTVSIPLRNTANY